MVDVKVLVACHHPLFHGPIKMNSYLYKGEASPNFVYDYVDTTAKEYGWLIPEEVDETRGNPVDKRKITAARKKEFKKSAVALRELPGHANTHIYENPTWEDVPANTYDIVTTIHCPLFWFGSIHEAMFTRFVENARRVLKPGGVFLFRLTQEDLEIPEITGFAKQTEQVEPMNVSTQFPEFWPTTYSYMKYTVVDNNVIANRVDNDTQNDYIDLPRTIIKLRKEIPQTQEDLEAETLAAMRTGGRKTYRMPRKYSRSYCRKTTCRKMGFTQRSSCRPYKNCFRSDRRGGSGTVSRQ